MYVKLLFWCHKDPLYSHSGVFCLAGPSVPVTHHYLSDNAPCTGFHIRLFHIYILFIILYSKAIWAFWNHCYLPLFFIFIFFHILNRFEHFETIVTGHCYPSDNARRCIMLFFIFFFLFIFLISKTNLKIWSYSLIFHNVRKWDTLKLSCWHISKIPVLQCPTMSHNVATISMKVSGWSPTETKSLVNACPRKWARSSQDIRCPHLPNLPDLPTWELPLRT